MTSRRFLAAAALALFVIAALFGLVDVPHGAVVFAGFLNDLFGGGSGGNAQTSSATTNNSASAGASEGSISISSQGSVTLAEPEAVKRAFDFASDIYKRSVDALNKGFDANVGQLAATLQKQTVDSGERVQATVQNVTTKALWALGGVAVIWLLKR